MGGGAGGWERTVYIFFQEGLERILILFFMGGHTKRFKVTEIMKKLRYKSGLVKYAIVCT